MTKRNMIIRNIRIMACLVCAMVVAFAYSSEQAFAAVPKVTGVKAKVVANRTVQVSWGKKAGVDGYTVYVATKKRGKYKARTNVGSESTSGKVSGLKVGKTYWFKVRSYSLSSGKKVYSKYSKRVKCIVKVAPPKVKATSVYESTKKIKISYTKSTGAKGYEIWRATSKGGKYKKIKTLAGTTFTDSNLTANKAYYYKVRAFSKKKSKKIYGGYSAIVDEISGGNSHQFDLSRYATDKNSTLKGKILFLGSSITLGTGTTTPGVSNEYMSFVDYLEKIDGVNAETEAVGGTTISRANGNNYVDRLKNNVTKDPDRKLVVCQLSTNDSRDAVLAPAEDGGEISGNDEGAVVDDLNRLYEKADTVRGAIDYITVYSQKELGCDVAFYVVPPFVSDGKFDAGKYAEFRNSLIKAKAFWDEKGYGFDIIDMWDTQKYPAFGIFKNANSKSEKRAFYMKDAVHPTKAGYLEKYTPVFRDYLEKNIIDNH